MNSHLMTLPQLLAARRQAETDLRRARASLAAMQAQRSIWAPLDTSAHERRVRRLEARLSDLDAQITAWRARHGS